MKTNDQELQNELKAVIQQQVELTDNKEQKIKLLTKLQETIENLLKENSDSTKLQRELKDAIKGRIELTDSKELKIKLLNKLQEMIETTLENENR